MDEPCDSLPTPTSTARHSPITDDDVSRLIVGTDVETLTFCDLSDNLLYGRKHRRSLTGSLADSAKSAGCEPVVYQSVLWWCFAFIPVVARGVYFVLPCVECDDLDGDSEQYRAIPAPWDSSQVTRHYLVTYGPILTLICAFGLWWWLR